MKEKATPVKKTTTKKEVVKKAPVKKTKKEILNEMRDEYKVDPVITPKPIEEEIKVGEIKEEEFFNEDVVEVKENKPDNIKVYNEFGNEIIFQSDESKIQYVSDNLLLNEIKEFMSYLNSPRGATPTVENMQRLESYHNIWFGLNYKILCCSNLQCKVYDKMMKLVGLK